VVIIGSGVSGLLAYKNTIKIGLNPIVFEAEERIGGVWSHTLESTRLQNSKEIYQFSDFPWPSSIKKHVSHSQSSDGVSGILCMFACIKFNSKVIGIEYFGESN